MPQPRGVFSDLRVHSKDKGFILLAKIFLNDDKNTYLLTFFSFLRKGLI